MIAGADLAAWLRDRNAQKASHARVEECVARWSRQPLMGLLQRELLELPVRTPEALLAAAARFMDSSAEVQALMEEMIASSRADPYFRPPFIPVSSDIHTGLLLFDTPDLSIAIGITGADMLAAKKAPQRGPTSIGFTGLPTMFRFLKAGGATFSFWEAPKITEGFVAANAGTCRLVERRRLEDGETIIVDGRRQSFVIEHAETDILYFQALVRVGGAPLGTEYDSRTFQFVGASSTDEASSRVQMMVTLLRTMERADALPIILEALNSPHFYTRWHIMRELLAIDAEAALPALRRMAAEDPHPEVRAAAQQTLALFFEEDDEDVAEGDAADEEMIACRA